MNELKRKQSRLPMFSAILLCLYYFLPRWIAIGLEFILLFYVIFLRSKGEKRVNYPIIWYVSFALVLALINVVYGVDGNSIYYLTTCINCLLFVMIISLSLRNQEELNRFILYFAISGFVFCLFLIPFIMSVVSGSGVRMGEQGGGRNAFMSSSITLGYITVLINASQYFCIFNPSLSRRAKYVFIALFVFSFFCILLTGTRKALLSSLLCIAVFTFLSSKQQFWRMIVYGAFLFGGVYFLLQLIMRIDFLYAIIGSRMEGLFALFDPSYAEVDSSTLARQRLIKTGVEIFRDNILFGAGIQGTQRLLMGSSHPHNNYLSCLDFGGLVCFFLYYIIIIKSVFGLIRKKVKDKVDMWMFGIIVALLFTDYAATTYNIILFPSFLTLVYIKSQFTSNNNLQ